MAIDEAFKSQVYSEEARKNFLESQSNLNYWNNNVLKEAIADPTGADRILKDFEDMIASINEQAGVAGLSPISASNYSNYNQLLSALGRTPQAGVLQDSSGNVREERSLNDIVNKPTTTGTPQGEVAQQGQEPQEPQGNIPIGEFQMKPGETIEQYNNRINSLRTATSAGGVATPAQGVPTTPISSYTGPSIVDYLNSLGQPSDRASRAVLAQRMGIQNYAGTAEQNTSLLNALRGGQLQANPLVNTSSTPPVSTMNQATQPSSLVNAQTLSQYGLSTPNPSQSPMLSFTDTYKELLESIGVPEIKGEFDRVQKEYDDLQNKLNDEIQDINDNPWLSEGVRVKQIQSLQNRYEGKSSILTNKLNLYNSLYEQGVDEAKFIAQQAYNQYQFETSTQLKLYELGQKQLEAERAERQQAFENEISLQELDIDRQKANNERSGLTPSQINTTVNSIAGAFDNEQIVKDYNAASAQLGLMQSLGTQGKNPGDDIAFVYAFAKLMDPNSVVREGEYNTIQKYAQSLLTKAELDSVRLVKNSNFLSAAAKQNLLNTATAKLKVLDSQYKNLSSEYQRQIDAAYSGQPRQLTNYQVPVSAPPPQTPENIFDTVVAGNSQTTPTQSSGWVVNLWNKLF